MKHFRPERITSRILYAGDDDLDRAAVYLSTILYDAGYGFDYFPSTESIPADFSFERYALFIISDYPSKNFSIEQMQHVASAIRNGASLLMVGGWESFSGMQKEYVDSPLREVLPVEMLPEDDRRNFSQGCVILPTSESPFLQDFDWERPPLIGGLNEVIPRLQSRVHLEAIPLHISFPMKRFPVTTSPQDVPKEIMLCRLDDVRFPLFITSPLDRGFSAALTVDLAPHWVGGLVDWGKDRIRLECEDRCIEIGSNYNRFVRALLTFCLSKGNTAT